jgi:RNA polymerase sigma-70 factor (ECF subfamily)
MRPEVAINAAFLERLRRRDPDALAEAVRDHARPLLRAARALGFAQPEAEDMVQDVFTTFSRAAGQPRGPVAASDVAVWHPPPKSVDDRVDPIDEVFESRFDARGKWVRPPADLERLVLSKEIGELIRGCMETLPSNQLEAFVLREVEGFETHEICKILDVSVTNFGVLLHRARARLRECLEARGWSHDLVQRSREAGYVGSASGAELVEAHGGPLPFSYVRFLFPPGTSG